MALQALAVYASHEGLGDVAADVRLSSSGWEHAFHLTDRNRLVQQIVSVPSLPGDIKISSAGSGCVLVQATTRYSAFGGPEKRGMRLTVEERPLDAHGCDRQTIRVCVAHSGPGNASSMALLQVSMLSGFEPGKNA
ncbi:unnamed protein product, partial [Darwinula stevensoni]